MDQVKDALAVLKKQHFWVLSVLVMIMAVVVWKIAAGNVGAQFETRKGELEGKLAQIEGIGKDSSHPNEDTIDAIKKLTGGLTGEVFTTWRFLFDQQLEKNPWPPELGQKFVSMVTAMAEDQEITRLGDREKYYYFIKNHLHKLDEIVDSLRPEKPEEDPSAADAGGTVAPSMLDPAAMGGTSREPVKLIGKVAWNASDRQRVQGGFVWDSVPNTIQIRLAQEDLWVYEALLRVIAETNIGATGYFNAPVKRIEALEIGQAAAGSMSSTQLFGSGGGMSSFGGEDFGGYGEMEGYGMESEEDEGDMGMDAGYMGGFGEMSGSAGGSGDEAIKARLMNGRYVDQFGQPLTAEEAENTPPFAEFKMMPIRLRLLVNQNKIADFLVDCANCTMPIDVRRVSLWPSNAASSAAMGYGGGGSGGGFMGMGGMEGDDEGGEEEMGYGMAGMGGMGGMDEMEGMSMGSAYGTSGSSAASVVTEVSVRDIPIEVQGIIYIFNKPQLENVATGSAADQLPPADVIRPKPPAGTPAETPSAESASPAMPATGGEPVAPPPPAGATAPPPLPGTVAPPAVPAPPGPGATPPATVPAPTP